MACCINQDLKSQFTAITPFCDVNTFQSLQKKKPKPTTTSVLLSHTITRPLAWGEKEQQQQKKNPTATNLEATAVMREFGVVSMLPKRKRTEYFCPAVPETTPFLPHKACLSFAP